MFRRSGVSALHLKQLTLMQLKQLNAMLQKLHRQKLICVATRSSHNKYARTTVPIEYWYLDYRQFVVVVAYRLHYIREALRRRSAQGDSSRLRCPTCSRTYDMVCCRWRRCRGARRQDAVARDSRDSGNLSSLRWRCWAQRKMALMVMAVAVRRPSLAWRW